MTASEEKPFFSVILPVFNGERYLRETLESVLRQTYPRWELVIVDDVSTDGTPAIIREYTARDPRIRSIRNEKNINCGPSANRGIEIARGDWITRIDADDNYKPDFLAALSETILARTGSHFFMTTWVSIIDGGGRVIVDVPVPSAAKVKRMLNVENYLYHTATCYSRQLWSKVGGYPDVQPDVLKVGGDDRVLWNKFFNAGAELIVLPKALMDYRIHFSNMSFVTGYGSGEWIISLYLKCGKLKEAREEIRKQDASASKNIQKRRFYRMLTYLPAGVVRLFMWEIRPWLRLAMRRLKIIKK